MVLFFQFSRSASNELLNIIPKYGLVLMSDSSKDISQQCDHMPSYRIPKSESSSIPYAPDVREYHADKISIQIYK